jgi:hypothetical protein
MDMAFTTEMMMIANEVFLINFVLSISSNESEASMRMGAPAVTSWRNHTEDMKVTVDMARDLSLNQLKDEVEYIRERFRGLHCCL